MPQPITTHVYGEYWSNDGRRSELGRLIHGLSSQPDPDAFDTLVGLLARWIETLDLPDDAVMVAVPAAEPRNAAGENLPTRLAEELAVATGRPFEATWLSRARTGPRLRDLPADGRAEVVQEAGYRADPAVAGRDLVLVDDVLLTGTTISHLADLALQAGAASVTAVVAARTRRV